MSDQEKDKEDITATQVSPVEEKELNDDLHVLSPSQTATIHPLPSISQREGEEACEDPRSANAEEVQEQALENGSVINIPLEISSKILPVQLSCLTRA